MLKIRTGSRDLKKTIQELVSLFESAGGMLNPNIQINVIGDQLSLAKHRPIKRDDTLIALPFTVAPFIDDFSYAYEDGLLEAAVKQGYECSSVHKEAMRLCVTIYNQLEKVGSFGKSSPLVQYWNNEKFLETLVAAGGATEIVNLVRNTDIDVTVAAFWASRAFFDAGTKKDRSIPVLEFVDHNIFANRFYETHPKLFGPGVELKYIPIKGLEGVYASYAVMDALESFMKYGFVDQAAFFVRSVPFVVELPVVGEVSINNFDINANKLELNGWVVAPEYRNSLLYHPIISKEEGGGYQLAYCLVPPKHHIPAFKEALLAQFSLLEKLSGAEKGSINNQFVYEKFLKVLVQQNRAYYRNLVRIAEEEKLIAGEPISKLLVWVLKHQLKIISYFEKHVQS